MVTKLVWIRGDVIMTPRVRVHPGLGVVVEPGLCPMDTKLKFYVLCMHQMISLTRLLSWLLVKIDDRDSPHMYGLVCRFSC